MNVFFGLPIPAQEGDVLTNLLIQEHPHWQQHPAIRWTDAQNYHITMHFFGQINPALLSELIHALSEYIQNDCSFSIEIKKLYNFPKENSDLVAAYIHLSSTLAKLYRHIQRAVEDYHFPPEERVYFPHITLCRGKRRDILTMEPIILPDYSISISSLVLYQTQSTPQGSQYVPLHQWLLQGRPIL